MPNQQTIFNQQYNRDMAPNAGGDNHIGNNTAGFEIPMNTGTNNHFPHIINTTNTPIFGTVTNSNPFPVTNSMPNIFNNIQYQMTGQNAFNSMCTNTANYAVDHRYDLNSTFGHAPMPPAWSLPPYYNNQPMNSLPNNIPHPVAPMNDRHAAEQNRSIGKQREVPDEIQLIERVIQMKILEFNIKNLDFIIRSKEFQLQRIQHALNYNLTNLKYEIHQKLHLLHEQLRYYDEYLHNFHLPHPTLLPRLETNGNVERIDIPRYPCNLPPTGEHHPINHENNGSPGNIHAPWMGGAS